MFLHGGAFQVGSCEAALYGPQVTFEVLPLSLLGSAGSLRCPSWSQLQIGSPWLVVPGLRGSSWKPWTVGPTARPALGASAHLCLWWRSFKCDSDGRECRGDGRNASPGCSSQRWTLPQGCCSLRGPKQPSAESEQKTCCVCQSSCDQAGLR